MKRFFAFALTGTMLMSSCVNAAEMPSNYWAADAMEWAVSCDYCSTDNYADFVTYEAGEKILQDQTEDWQYRDENIFDITDYTNSYITRGEWAQALNESFDLVLYGEDESAEPANYADVDNSCPYKEAIDKCYNLGIMNGYEDNTFRPDEYITYAELSTTLLNIYNGDSDYYSDFDYEPSEFEKYLSEYPDRLADIISKAESGELKSNKKLSSELKAVVDELVEKSAKQQDVLHDKVQNIDADIDIKADIDVYGQPVEADLKFNIDGAIRLNDDMQPDEMALKMVFNIDSPELEALAGESLDEINDKPIEIYLKDDMMYINAFGEKIAQEYDAEIYEELGIKSTGMSEELTKYILTESVTDGKITKNSDGSEEITYKLDIKDTFKAIGLDIDKILELSNEESDAKLDISFKPCVVAVVFDAQGRQISDNTSINANFKYIDEVDAEMTGNVSCDVKSNISYDSEEIKFPSFKDYKSLDDFINVDAYDEEIAE